MKNWVYVCGEPISKEDMANIPTGFEEMFFGVDFPSRKAFCDAGFLACHAKAEFENGIMLKDSRCMAAAEYLREELDKVLDRYKNTDKMYYDDHSDEIEDMHVHW